MKIYFLGIKGIPAKSGGVERHVENLAADLAKNGHDVFIYSRKKYTGKSWKTYRGVKIIYIPTISSKYLETVIHVFLASIHVLFRNADVIQYDSIGPALFMWIPRLFKRGPKIVFEFHCRDYFHAKWGSFARLMLSLGELMGCGLADEVVVTSKELRRYVKSRYRISAPVVRSHVTLPEVSRHAGNRGQKAPIVIVSRMIPHKNIHRLIEAFRETMINRELWIVGKPSFTDGYCKYLHALARGDKRIKFLGEKTGRALHFVYERAGIVVQPSSSEGASLALLEAMSHGKVIIASNIASNKEVLGNTGTYFKASDRTDLRKKLEYVSRNFDHLMMNARRTVRRVQKNHGSEAKKMERIYQYE